MGLQILQNECKPGSVREKVNEYFYGFVYPVITAAIVLVSWVANLQFLGLAYLVITACYIFITQRDLVPILPLLFSAPMTFTDLSSFSTVVPYVIFSPVFIAIIVRFIRFPIKKVFIGELFFPLIVVSLALFAGGLFSTHLDVYHLGLIYIFSVGVAMLTEYFVLGQYIEVRKDFDLKKYFSVCIITVSMLSFMQLIFVDALSIINGRPPIHGNFTWANTIHIGYMTLFSIPLCFYLMANAKNIIPQLILVFLLSICAILTASDGTIGLLAICLFPLVVYSYFKIRPENRTLYSLFFLCLFCVSVVALMMLCATLKSDFFSYICNHFLDDNGRTNIYKLALNAFRRFPIFGAGLGYPKSIPKCGGYFHSTLFQVFGTMGIVGAAVYIWYFAVRIKIFIGKQSLFNFYAFVSFLLFELYSFIDNGEFTFLMIYATAFVLITELHNKKDKDFEPLPLKTDLSNKFS